MSAALERPQSLQGPSNAIDKPSGDAKVILLTGAPRRGQLDWQEDGLAQKPDAAFGRKQVGAASISSVTTSSFQFPKWRSLATRHALMSHQEQIYEDTEFLSSGAIDYEASLHQLDLVLPNDSVAFSDSAAIPDDLVSTAESIEATIQSFYSALSESEQRSETEAAGMPTNGARMVPSLAITDLKVIPNAARLCKIAPQDRLVHLLVCIITIQPLRTIQLRRRNAQMDIVEIMVGDETRAGFNITVWLGREGRHAGQSGNLRSAIMALRPGEIVLFRNLVLSAYRGCVYGQSLSRSITFHGTTIYRAHDHHLELSGMGGKVPGLAAWARRFLGHDARTVGRTHAAKNREALPPDTPDG